MTYDDSLLRAFARLYGYRPDDDRPAWDGGIEGPHPDDHVTDSEARDRQRAHDSALTERWGPQC